MIVENNNDPEDRLGVRPEDKLEDKLEDKPRVTLEDKPRVNLPIIIRDYGVFCC